MRNDLLPVRPCARRENARVGFTACVRRRPTRLGVMIAALAALSAMAGCPSRPINDKPFDAFAESTREIRTGASNAVGKIAEMSKERYLLRASKEMYANPSDQVTDVQALQLQFGESNGEPDKSKWTSEGTLLFLTLERFRLSIDLVNGALVNYTSLLDQLASPELIDPAWFDGQTKQLNADLRSAAAAAGIKDVQFAVGSRSVDSIALFSTLATEIAKRNLFQIQRQKLIEVIRANQPDIDTAAGLGRQAISLAANALWQEYNLQSQVLVYRGLGKTPDGRADDPRLSERDKKAAIEDLLELNSAFTLQLDGLRTLDRAYANLPAAHKDLATNLERAPGLTATVRDLYDSGRRLQKIYEELGKASARAGAAPVTP